MVLPKSISYKKKAKQIVDLVSGRMKHQKKTNILYKALKCNIFYFLWSPYSWNFIGLEEV